MNGTASTQVSFTSDIMSEVEQDVRLTYNSFCTILTTLANLSVIVLMIYGKQVPEISIPCEFQSFAFSSPAGEAVV